MKNILKRYSYIPIIVLSLWALFALFQHKLFILKGSKPLSPEQVKELSLLGSKAIPSLDVPVASLLLYHDQIIGRGYNTVNIDTNITAHAEINAINAAIRTYGFEKFNRLDRNHLKLITTYEPCSMCRSVIIGCGIQQIEFIKGKSFYHWLKEDIKQYRYEGRKTRVSPENLQDSLFHLHPLYDPNKNRE
jgi:tRNA(Arg) A34 adenosine deaminase TadA